jgi:hypothetical protein
MPLFTLEALEAKHGDSLILHYGDEKAPRFILIDGGPGGVYKDTLRPRLVEIRKAWHPGPLPLEMVMVSHIDDDHVNGILDLTDELIKKKVDPVAEILCLWHNSFDDVLGNVDEDLFSRLSSKVKAAALGEPQPPGGANVERHVAAVAASVGQGRKLRSNAEKLELRTNDPFDGLVLAGAGGTRFDWGDGLGLTVLGPSIDRVKELHKKWEKELEEKGAATAIAAAYTDGSVFNLSSIVVLAELEGKRMLLTGDARGDHILEAVKEAGLLTNDRLHVEILKMPHHGSDHNVELDFFQTITADHYVFSGDGGYGNPELATLRMVMQSRTDDDFTLHLTYRDGKKDLGAKIDQFLAERDAVGRTFKMEFRKDGDRSLKVDLHEPVTY